MSNSNNKKEVISINPTSVEFTNVRIHKTYE